MKTIIIAPSGKFEIADYNQGVAWLTAHNFTILKHAQQRETGPRYLNGTDHERLIELEHALNNPSATLCWIARGGYGLNRLLPLLEKSTHPSRPLVVGYSDATALLCHLWATEQRKGIHGPNINRIAKQSSQCLEALNLLLTKSARSIRYPSFNNMYLPKPLSEIRGVLLPVNLCVLTTLIGTRAMPNLSGTILMIEDIGEPPYKIDRLLTHLWATNHLQGVVAIIVGHVSNCGDDIYNSNEALEAIKSRCVALQIPLFDSFPFGHENPNWPLPFGCKATVTIAEECTLSILEEVVD